MGRRLCGATDWRLTLLPLTAAVAIIPLTASLALKFTGSTRTALIAASLAAFNPYLVMWGPVIRSYSLLVALSLLAINEFFHWYWRSDWWSGVRCAAVVLLLLLAHLNGVYTVAFLILLLAVETISAGWSGGTKVSLGRKNALDPIGWSGDNSRRSLLATLARYRQGQPRMGNRYSANEHGISSAGLYHVHGCRLRRLVVRLFSCSSAVGRRCERSERFFCCVQRSFWRRSSCPCKGSLFIRRRSPAISFFLFLCF